MLTLWNRTRPAWGLEDWLDTAGPASLNVAVDVEEQDERYLLRAGVIPQLLAVVGDHDNRRPLSQAEVVDRFLQALQLRIVVIRKYDITAERQIRHQACLTTRTTDRRNSWPGQRTNPIQQGQGLQKLADRIHF